MTHGYVNDKGALVRRLHRIEGQVRGVERMVEEERYCIELVTQISATTTALDQVGLKLLEDHVRHCVRSGGKDKVPELMAAVERFVRTR
jgi:CsoR family transcriptional regulator, copper-sensing transcriptional repressor